MRVEEINIIFMNGNRYSYSTEDEETEEISIGTDKIIIKEIEDGKKQNVVIPLSGIESYSYPSDNVVIERGEKRVAYGIVE